MYQRFIHSKFTIALEIDSVDFIDDWHLDQFFAEDELDEGNGSQQIEGEFDVEQSIVTGDINENGDGTYFGLFGLATDGKISNI